LILSCQLPVSSRLHTAKRFAGNLKMISTVPFRSSTLYLDEPMEAQSKSFGRDDWRALAQVLRAYPLKGAQSVLPFCPLRHTSKADWDDSCQLSWVFVSLYGSTWQEKTTGLDYGSRRLAWFKGAWKQGMLDKSSSRVIDVAEALGLFGQSGAFRPFR
jgi:hypothetical protein